jgi:hypothetical protein
MKEKHAEEMAAATAEHAKALAAEKAETAKALAAEKAEKVKVAEKDKELQTLKDKAIETQCTCGTTCPCTYSLCFAGLCTLVCRSLILFQWQFDGLSHKKRPRLNSRRAAAPRKRTYRQLSQALPTPLSNGPASMRHISTRLPATLKNGTVRL